MAGANSPMSDGTVEERDVNVAIYAVKRLRKAIDAINALYWWQTFFFKTPEAKRRLSELRYAVEDARKKSEGLDVFDKCELLPDIVEASVLLFLNR